MQELDQKTAIMTVIEHFGDIKPGTKCSAVFFDEERIRREQEFHAQLYSQNGVNDPEIRKAMRGWLRGWRWSRRWCGGSGRSS